MVHTNKLEQFEIAQRPDGTLWELGRGPMGIVYKGLDTLVESDVALKVINPQHLNSEINREHFLREARTVVNFRHPNVATLFEAGNSEGRIFCAMEYIEGETLDRRVKHKGALHPVSALRITGQVTRALIAADRRNLVHGNIKPSNIMLLLTLLVKVTDYGLVRCLTPASDLSAGVPDYASPEQLKENAMDIRSDIYSLGATLWFMLTGQPFQRSLTSVAEQRMDQSRRNEILTRFPKELAALLDKMLAERPEERLQTPLELKSELDQLLTELKDEDWAPSETVTEAIETANASDMGLTAGQVIRNEYLILREPVAEKSVCQAKELQSDRIVSLCPLPLAASYDAQWLSNLQTEIGKLQIAQHPNLLEVIGLESDESGFFIVSEWVNGFSLEELTRARRQLSWAEALAIVKPLADALDFIAERQLPTRHLSLKNIFVNFSDSTSEQEVLQRGPVSNWPSFVVKVDLLNLEQVSQKHLPEPYDLRNLSENQIRQLSILIYELLSRAELPASTGEPTLQLNPLPSLSENANAVLSFGVSEPKRFASASDFLRKLELAESGAEAPIPILASAVTPVTAQVHSEGARGEWHPRKSPSKLRILVRSTALLVLFGVVGFFIAQFMPAKPILQAFDPNTAPGNFVNRIQASFVSAANAILASFSGVAHANPVDQTSATPTPVASPILNSQVSVTPPSVANPVPDSHPSATPPTVGNAVSPSRTSFTPRNIAVDPRTIASASVTPVGGNNLALDKNEKSASPPPAPVVGRLAVKSDPSGLKVEIVSQAQQKMNGVTPMTLENLPVTHYTVTIKRDGWPDYQQEVNLESNVERTVEHNFVPVKVTLQSDPSGASIFMGDSELGKTPLIVSLPPNPVELVSRSGILAPVTQRIVPDPNGSTVVEFKHSYGMVSVNSDRPDAEVVLGGVNLGKPPIEEIVPSGPQQVIVQVPGMPDQTQTAKIQNGQRTVLQFKFASPMETSKASPAPANQAPPIKDVRQSSGSQSGALHRRVRHSLANRSKETRPSGGISSQFDTRQTPKEKGVNRQKDSADCGINPSAGVAQTKSILKRAKQASDSCN